MTFLRNVLPDRDRNVATLKKNYVTYKEMCRRADLYRRSGDDAAAAAWVEIAALHACSSHCGLTSDPSLERILVEIGRRLPPVSSRAERDCRFDLVNGAHVLHVATAVSPVGGLSHFLWRWIEADDAHRHSVALTHQLHGPLPEKLVANVTASGGAIHLTNRTIGTVLQWAAELRQLAAEADMVVLHIGNHDVVPLLALAAKEQLPPVILVNHSDHLFWLGTAIADLVASYREAGREHAIERRDIEPRRSHVLPIIVDPVASDSGIDSGDEADGNTAGETSREAARRTLGLPEDAIVLLSVARGMKYRPWMGMTFADAHLDVLAKHPEAMLVVVGAGGAHDWSSAARRVGGRILCHPERPDTALFYQAADIYVDSFPYCSVTSLLEAGMHGLPLVSRLPYTPRIDLMGPQVPGIAPTLVQTESLGEYGAELDRLIEDATARQALGNATREGIARAHTGAGWIATLNKIYRAAYLIPRRIHLKSVAPATPNFAEPDSLLPSFGNWDADPHRLVLACLRLMPYPDRLRELARMTRESGLRQVATAEALKGLLPEWLLVRARGLRPVNVDPDRRPEPPAGASTPTNRSSGTNTRRLRRSARVRADLHRTDINGGAAELRDCTH